MPAPYGFKCIFSSFYRVYQHVRITYNRFHFFLGYFSLFHLSFGMSAEYYFHLQILSLIMAQRLMTPQEGMGVGIELRRAQSIGGEFPTAPFR